MAEDDSRLLSEARRGDEGSFLSLYYRYRTPLYRFAWRLTASTAAAEDVVQECWVVALEAKRFDEARGGLRAYLFGVARNLAFARLRVSGRECDEAAETEAAGSPFEDVLSSERSDAVARAIAALPPLQREALILFEYEDLSLEEIAAVAGIEIGAVKARLHRARETLRRRLAPLLETRETRRCSQ
jgi:RNA polymerase sigma-70 factor, ECF subfamily